MPTEMKEFTYPTKREFTMSATMSLAEATDEYSHVLSEGQLNAVSACIADILGIVAEATGISEEELTEAYLAVGRTDEPKNFDEWI